VPSGSDFKATMMIEYPNEADRKVALAKLVGIEHKIFIEIEGQPRVYAIADEDLERSTAEKTSAVHFMRFDLTEDMKKALQYMQDIQDLAVWFRKFSNPKLSETQITKIMSMVDDALMLAVLIVPLDTVNVVVVLLNVNDELPFKTF
jgi:hypothetical protein